MKGAIASVEIFAFVPEHDTPGPRRLTLTIGAPTPDRESGHWDCRVALADLHRAETKSAVDSVSALEAALEQGRVWLAELRARGWVLARDRAGKSSFELA